MNGKAKARGRALVFGAALAAALLAAGSASANITYLVNQAFGDGSVKGTLTTDGTLGGIIAPDFVAWDLTVTGKGGSTFDLVNGKSGVFTQGSDLFATATQITFDFSGGDNGYFLVQESFGNGLHYWCNSTYYGTCNQGKSAVPDAYNSPSAVFVNESGVQVIAGGVPEPSTWALMLLGFAGLGYTGYRQARKPSAAAIG
jgi:hypothetical protein